MVEELDTIFENGILQSNRARKIISTPIYRNTDILCLKYPHGGFLNCPFFFLQNFFYFFQNLKINFFSPVKLIFKVCEQTFLDGYSVKYHEILTNRRHCARI